MENTAIPYFTPDVITHFRALQDREHIRRTVTGEYEPVNFPPGSSVRIWVNIESISYAPHWHTATEIIVPVDNIYTVLVRDQEYILKPGDIFIIPSGELHQLIGPENGARLFFLFDLSVLHAIKGFPYLASVMAQPVLINEKMPIYNAEMKLLYQMLCDYYNENALRELMIFSKLINFYVEYEGYQSALNSPTPPHNQKDIMDRLNIVFYYIDEHYAEGITLEKAAEIAGFSKYHFSRIFKQFSGCNFYDYLCFHRIKIAEQLLLTPGISITDIAYQAGFGSLCTFNRTFKKVKACTPSEYRSKHLPI